MKIGDLVWNHYHGLLRFGTITEKKIKEDKWAYFTVDWHADEDYERSQSWREKLSGVDHTLKEYRKTQLKPFNPEQLGRILEQFKKKKQEED
tara:strand:+ start:1209 stop:1484 length:276 start_codon:yes stop_codon:yes gene_type:complete